MENQPSKAPAASAIHPVGSIAWADARSAPPPGAVLVSTVNAMAPDFTRELYRALAQAGVRRVALAYHMATSPQAITEFARRKTPLKLDTLQRFLRGAAACGVYAVVGIRVWPESDRAFRAESCSGGVIFTCSVYRLPGAEQAGNGAGDGAGAGSGAGA